MWPTHAERLAPGQHAVAVQVGNGVAVQLVAGTGIELEVARQRQRIGTGLLGGLAAVALFDGGQLVGVFGDLGRQLHEQAATLGCAQLGPHGVVALARGAHGGVDVLRIAALQLVKRLAVGGIDDGEGAARCRWHGRVGDVVQLHAQDSRANAAAHYLLQQLTRQSLTNTA
jgi:hypothetical protein